VAAGRAPALAVNGDGSIVRDYVHVTDVADAFALALQGCAAGAHPASNGGATPASVADILGCAREVTGRPIPVTWNRPREEPPVLVADCALGRRELGWTPARSALRQIIADTWAAVSPPCGPPRLLRTPTEARTPDAD
jgi:UDP-glucose 4-epimerase